MFTANVIVDKKLSKNHSFNVALRFIGRQFSPIVIQRDGQHIEDPFPDEGVSYFEPQHYVDNTTLVNANWQWQASSKLKINLQVNNLFDQQYYQGGSTLHPYQQTGRWYHLKATYRF